MATTTAPAEEQRGEQVEEPFQLVTSKRRPKPGSRKKPQQKVKSVSNSTGSITGASNGFAYASSSSNSKQPHRSKEEQNQRILKSATEAVDVFVAYLGSALREASREEEEEARRSFAESVRDTLNEVWPLPPQLESQFKEVDTTYSKDKGKGKGKAVVPSRIVCLGLGSPTGSRGAQIQLALLVIIRRWLLLLLHAEGSQESRIDVVAYDPIFTATDQILLSTYSVRAVSNPEEASKWYTHPITTPTLLYMPHCDRELYEAVLSLSYPSSQSEMHPPPVVLLSNVLKNYTTFNTATQLEASSPTLARLIHAFANPVLVPNWENAKRSALTPSASIDKRDNAEQAQESAKELNLTDFARLWDKNALRELGFHWLT